MATQTIRVNLGRLSGTFTADIYFDNFNTTFATAVALSAEVQPGFYTFVLTSSAGLYSIIVKESGVRIGSWYVRTTDTAETFPASDTRDEANAATERLALLTTALTESYAADGVAPTLSQVLFLIQQQLSESAISGTTKTVKKLDGSTTTATFTL